MWGSARTYGELGDADPDRALEIQMEFVDGESKPECKMEMKAQCHKTCAKEGQCP